MLTHGHSGKKHVLVVDDSRSARLVLQRMLEKHGIVVSTAESAEEAMDYLSHNTPQVIFMDHMMPGMDGFQAVQAIKRNPETATIPIVMYTAQSGEVYVGQARALGAFDVLSKSIQPQKLQQILQTLNLLPKVVSAVSANDSGPVATSTQPRAYDETAPRHDDVTRLLEQLSARLRLPDFTADFAELRLSLRRELKQLHAQNDALGQRLNQQQGELQQDVQQLVQASEQQSRSRRRYAAAVAVVAALALAVIWWRATPYVHLSDGVFSPEQVEARVHNLQQQNQQLDTQLKDLAAAIPVVSNSTGWLSALEWSLNRHGSFGFSTVPLGDEQAVFLNELLQRLNDVGFTGVVELQVHLGDFCMRSSGSGDFQPVTEAIALQRCPQLGFGPEQAFEISARQSINFSNFINSSPLLADGRISLQIIAMGNLEPRYSYPHDHSGSVAEWNQIAAANSRFVVHLWSRQ